MGDFMVNFVLEFLCGLKFTLVLKDEWFLKKKNELNDSNQVTFAGAPKCN